MSYEITTTYFGMMPNQAQGMLNGKPFYFRARHGEWALRVATEESKDAVLGKCIASGKDKNAGWWEENETKAFVEALLKERSDADAA